MPKPIAISKMLVVSAKAPITPSKEKLASKVYSVDEVVSAMKENFSYCWYQFNKFWFIYINRWREELKDLEVFSIGLVVLINAIKNKEFTPKKPNMNKK